MSLQWKITVLARQKGPQLVSSIVLSPSNFTGTDFSTL
jgi:hypothetical protein